MYFEFLFVGFHLHLETVKSEIKKFNLLKEDFYVNTSLVWKYSKIIFSILITWIIMPAFEKNKSDLYFVSGKFVNRK